MPLLALESVLDLAHGPPEPEAGGGEGDDERPEDDATEGERGASSTRRSGGFVEVLGFSRHGEWLGSW